jgi:hypothetical protein
MKQAISARRSPFISFEMDSVKGIDTVRVRFGPFPMVLPQEEELAKTNKIEKSRGASWVYVDCHGGRAVLQL